MICQPLLDEASALLDACRARGVKLATAESCTGGLIAGTLSAIPGSSDVLDRGFVTYSNESKIEMVGVPPQTIAAAGAVSEAVVHVMADGALRRSHADIAVAVTGVAGPGGASAEKPVGLIWFGLAQRGHPTTCERRVFPGDRTAIRMSAVKHAFDLIRTRL